MNTSNAKNLARYHGRSPRYILDTNDDSLIRVAGPNQVPWEEGTTIRNVSLTGLAFTAPEDLCPVLGEVIKIQFSVPGSSTMACYALVIRHEAFGKPSSDGSANQILVGVHFYKLEMPHRINLAQGLAEKAHNLSVARTAEKESAERVEPKPAKLMLAMPFAFALSFFLVAWLVSMTVFTRFSSIELLEMLAKNF